MKKLMTAVIVLLSNVAFAEEVTNAVSTASAAGPGDKIYFGIAAAVTIALAAVGGTLGQAKVAAAAMEGIGRNPNAKDSIQTPMILGLVFIETVVLFGLLIAFLLVGKAV